MTDYYQILGISREAGIQEIKAAFKKLALQHHPDRNAGSRAAEEKFKQINEAYQVLSDANGKWLYDLKLNGNYTTEETTQQATYQQTYTQEYSRPYSPPVYRYDPYTARKAYMAGTVIILILSVLGYFLYGFMNHRSARASYAEALYYIDRNQAYNAFIKLEEAIEYDDEYAEAYLKRGQLWLKLDPNSIHAYEDFDRAIRYAELPDAEMYLFRAMSLFRMGKYEQVLTDCAQASQTDTLKGPAVFLQAAAKKALQDHQGACQDWQQAYTSGFESAADSLSVHCR